ncbi:DUF5666 domain-containing protein [Methylobacterium sp. A54F]
MRQPAPHRRRVLHLLAGVAGALLPGALPPGSGLAAPGDAPRDQGIGGTGARPAEEPGGSPLGEGDRGIGGTGVIGTIRRFGSIIVNDLRIAYPKDVAVEIDGVPARAADLRIGHVVRVVARPEGDGLATGRIAVTSEVVGPVEAVAKGGLTVLGQRVSTAGLKGRWAVGERVAVSGLRRPDGVIVASLVEARGPGPARVAGPVRRGADGTPMIGGLRLDGAGAGLVGRRALVTGEPVAGAAGLAVARAVPAEAGFVPGLRRVSIEAYIGRRGDRIALGSGLPVSGSPSAEIPRRGSVRAVLTTDVAADGRLTVERLRVEDRIAPTSPERGIDRPPGGPQSPRFERLPDRLDPRGGSGLREGLGPRGGLPDRGPGGVGGPRGLDIDTRTAPGPAGGFGGPAGGFGGPAGGVGGPPGGFGGGNFGGGNLGGAVGGPGGLAPGGGPGGGLPGGGLPGGGLPGGLGGRR